LYERFEGAMRDTDDSADSDLPLHHAALPQPRLHLAVVTETYPPEINGVAMTLERVVHGLVERGHRVQLIRPRQPADGRDDQRQAEPELGLELHLCAGLSIPLYPQLRLGLPAKRRLAALWRDQRPDIVHVATEGPLGRSAVSAARALGIAVTSDFRTNFHAYAHHYRLGWLHGPLLSYLRAFHNRTAITMVPTDALRQQLAAAGFGPLEVVSRGVDIGRFDPSHRSAELRRRWGADGQHPVVLHVGRLAAEKNIDLLLRTFRAICTRYPRSRLVFVGDGPLQQRLQSEMPQAVFAGVRRGTDLAAHYASADLFVFPSLTETFGNVTAEAMASGLPVVAFDYAAAAQLIRPGVSGVLVARGNEVQFERAAVALAGSHATRVVMGACARLHASVHDWASVLARFETLLRSAAAPGGTPMPPPQVRPFPA
jgi:glycosyltransferase involved in cell wall biosynthesis